MLLYLHLAFCGIPITNIFDIFRFTCMYVFGFTSGMGSLKWSSHYIGSFVFSWPQITNTQINRSQTERKRKTICFSNEKSCQIAKQYTRYRQRWTVWSHDAICPYRNTRTVYCASWAAQWMHRESTFCLIAPLIEWNTESRNRLFIVHTHIQSA